MINTHTGHGTVNRDTTVGPWKTGKPKEGQGRVSLDDRRATSQDREGTESHNSIQEICENVKKSSCQATVLVNPRGKRLC